MKYIYKKVIQIILIVFNMLLLSPINSQELKKDMQDDSKYSHNHEESSSHTHKGIIPAGLMVPHSMSVGKWMVDFQSMNMNMNQVMMGKNRVDPLYLLLVNQYNTTVVTGSSDHSSHTTASSYALTPTQVIPVLQYNSYKYMSVPEAMFMQMNMASLMYQATEKFNIMFMLPYLSNTMRMFSSNYETSFMKTSGVGDISVTGSYKILEGKNNLAFQFGVSLPTGSTDLENYMPLMGKSRSPYNMQTGSGTYSAIPSISYNYLIGAWTFGSFVQGTFRSAKNDNAYKFGNIYISSIWIGRNITQNFSLYIRGSAQKWENITGSDPKLDYRMDPQNDPARQGGIRYDGLIGITINLWSDLNIALEGGVPVYQHLNGPQVGTTQIFNFKVNKTL